MIFVLNSPVLTAYGQWQFDGPISIEEAKALLAGQFTSAIGHLETAQFLSMLLELDVPRSRVEIIMQPGDEALVLRLRQRLEAGQLLSKEELNTIPYDLAHLRRLA